MTLKPNLSSTGSVFAFLNGNNTATPDHAFMNTTGMDVLTVSGVTGFAFIDQVAAALKPTTDGNGDNGIKVQGGTDSSLRLEPGASDTTITVDPTSTATSGSVSLDDGSATGYSRFATGVNHIIIRVNDSGHALITATALGTGVFLKIDTGAGTNDTIIVGEDDTVHEQATVLTGAGNDLVSIEPNNGDDGAEVIVDFVYATHLGLDNQLDVYSNGSAILDNASGSPHTEYVDRINAYGSSSTQHGGVEVDHTAVIDDLHVHDQGTATINAGATITTFEVDGADGQASIEAACDIGTMEVDGLADFDADSTVDNFHDSGGTVNVFAGTDVTVEHQSDMHNLNVYGTGASLLFEDTGTHVDNLAVYDGGLVSLEPRPGVPEENPAKVLIIDNSLDVKGSSMNPSGTLDLADNALIVDYGSNPYAYVRDAIKYAYDGGAWDRPGVSTSLGGTIASPSDYAGDAVALGYADNANLGKTTFEGESVDSSTVLVKWTFEGDANLDGMVDVTDLGALATGWQTSDDWWRGDFDYSGFVDVTDLGLLATNWQEGTGSGPLRPGGGSNPEDEFLDGISGLGLSQEQIDGLLEILGSGGGDPI